MGQSSETPIYKIHVHDRNYTEWTFFNTTDFKEVKLDINPVEEKLFSNDVFMITEKIITIIHSTIRISESIAGVLILKGNKTYGRNSSGKLLYKCIPDDIRLPAFLVPYDMKKVGFSKVFQNLYVTFHFCEWNQKHPQGLLSHTIGPVDVLDNFYEYQLYCKSLNASIQKFTKETSKALKLQPHDAFIENISKRYENIEDRTSLNDFYIFTIDPLNTVDFDDAFSIKTLANGQTMLSIYIANVTLWMDILGLWDSFSRRISTIYLPDRKRPMLPTILSDCLCSLQEKTVRLAFVMDIFIDNGEINKIKYSNCKINVSKNYCYEEAKLLANKDYQKILHLTNQLNRKYKYIQNIRNSHDIVSYLMILMNYHCAKELVNKKSGICRSTFLNKDFGIQNNLPHDLPDDVHKFIKIWNSSAGQYLDISLLKDGDSFSHDLLEMDAYIHITSPIRRLVDLLNMIKIQGILGLITMSEEANKFYNKWIKDLDYINITMRSIKKVQNDCSLLHICNNDPSILEGLYDGYTFDKIGRNDGLYQYIIYLPELKLSSRVTMREDISNYQIGKYKLYLFNDEENFKKKIRLHKLQLV